MHYGFPGVIGLIDGTHVLIKKPETSVEHIYYCIRKASHSKNVQIVIICDSIAKLLTILTHDKLILIVSDM